MRLYEGLEAILSPLANATVAIGTFDGVHLGHRAIIHTALDDARRHERPAVVFTFDRHPQELLQPLNAPSYLTTPAQRNRLVEEYGADALMIARFDETLSQYSPERFLRDILKGILGAKAIVVGKNFGFGKGRAGDAGYLQDVQSLFDFQLFALDPVLVDGLPASSTRTRELIQAGDIETAERVLGHPYLLAGMIIGGQRLGRTLGYPTANLGLITRQVIPPDGIYAVQALLDDGRALWGACSIGERPTVEGAGRAIETFLFTPEGAFKEDIYGRGMELRFVRRLRGEEKFASLEDLTRQMALDVEKAREVLGNISSDRL